MGVEISVLGGTVVRVDGTEQDLGGRRTAEVLALLVAADGATVDADVLADQLWRGSPPATARTTLQGYVARLRRVLEPGTAAREARLLQSRGTGYRLELPAGTVDVRRFVAGCREAERRSAEGAAADAADRLEVALASWAAPYPEVADVPALQPVLARLAEQRLTAVEALAALRLELGREQRLVADLVGPARDHPLREPLQILLARAHYRAGRQVEALDTLRATRERLADELGLDPSPELRELEQAMLRQEPSLGRPTVGNPAAAAVGPAGAAAAFVGRADALALLGEGWADAVAGRTTVVVVTGEPGIGKTALVERFLAGVPAAAVRRGRGLRTPGVPPYWVWQQVVGGLPGTSVDAGARFALGLDLARRLALAADEQPIAVLVDDLQWADEDSLHVLEVVLDQLTSARALLVLVVREEALAAGTITRVLGQVARLVGSRRVPLGGLAGHDLAELACSVSGEEWPAEAVETLMRRSGGNPFFATELARLGPARHQLPHGVRDVLRLRTRDLSNAATDLAQVLAVAGRELAAGFAAAVLGLPRPGLDAAVEDAVAHGVLARGAGDRLGFCHDLLREVVDEDIAPGRRAELHEALADALAGSAAAVTSAAAIAVHRSEAAAGNPSDPAARACLAAAEEAYARAGSAEARDFALRGLRHAVPGSATLSDLQRVLGQALRHLGLLDQGLEALGAASRTARELDDRDREGLAALAASGGGIGGYWSLAAIQRSLDSALLAAAVERSEGMARPLRASLLAALAVQRAAVGHPALDLAEEALSLAADDPRARARARVAGYVARWTPAWAEQRLDLARRMLEEAAGDPAYEMTALHLYRCALLETGQVDESEAVSRRFTELVDRRGDGDQLLLDLWWRSGLALARGDVAEARRTADEAVESAPTVSPAAAQLTRMSRQTVEGIIAWHERRLTDEIPEVVDLAATVDPDWLTVLAQAHAQAGRRAEALAAVDRLLEQPREATREPVRAILLADVYLELGEKDRAAELLPLLETYGDTVVVLWVGTTVLGPVALYRGGLKALLGRPDAADELRRAVELSECCGFAPFAARARALLDGLAAAQGTVSPPAAPRA